MDNFLNLFNFQYGAAGKDAATSGSFPGASWVSREGATSTRGWCASVLPRGLKLPRLRTLPSSSSLVVRDSYFTDIPWALIHANLIRFSIGLASNSSLMERRVGCLTTHPLSISNFPALVGLAPHAQTSHKIPLITAKHSSHGPLFIKKGLPSGPWSRTIVESLIFPFVMIFIYML